MKKSLIYLNIHTVMPVFKVSFLNNAVVSCTEMDNVYFDGRVFYELDKGQLNFAYISAKSKEEAFKLADIIIDEVVNGETGKN